jgi:hypothetical protein
MSISINYPDKVLAGVRQSLTITSDEGAPDGEVLLDGQPLARSIVRLRPPVWKVTFSLPQDSAGKAIVLRFRNESVNVEETKTVEKG